MTELCLACSAESVYCAERLADWQKMSAFWQYKFRQQLDNFLQMVSRIPMFKVTTLSCSPQSIDFARLKPGRVYR